LNAVADLGPIEEAHTPESMGDCPRR